MLIEVRSTECRRRKREGQPDMLIQTFALLREGNFPVVFERVVDAPFAVGQYEWTPVFKTNQWQDLELNRFEFNVVPVKAPGK